MSAYKAPVDIANRAIQHCRKEHIRKFADHSSEAHEVSFVYDKLREAELRRNLWRFATRRVVLRPIDVDTKLYTPPAYAAGTTYATGAVVIDTDGNWWQSSAASNLGNTLEAGENWRHYYGNDTANEYDATVSYFAGELAWSGSATYLSLVSQNEGNDPPSAGNWLVVTGTLAALQIVYPIGTGPGSNATTANVYRLPYGYLRQAPRDPKGSMHQYLGVPQMIPPLDWLFEGRYFVVTSLSTTDPKMMRYVADVTDVPDFDPMFCEMLGARIATEIGPTLWTDDDAKAKLAMASAASAYRMSAAQARTVNAIEIGQEDRPTDPYISCRL